VQLDDLVFATHFNPIHDSNGDPAGTIGVSTDITQAHRAQRALSESEAKYRSVVDNAPAFIITADLQGRIQFINRTVPDLTVEEVLGTTIFDHLDPDQEKISRQAISKVIQTGQPHGYEVWRPDPEGNRACFSCQCGPIKREGDVVGVTIIATDVTEERKREEQLQVQAQLLDSVREAVVATDLDGHITYWSKGAQAMYGYSPDEVVGQEISALIVVDPESEGGRRIEQVRENGRWSGQFRQRRKDGGVLWADAVISLVTDSQNQPCGYIGINRDVSSQKQAFEALHESEERFRTTFESASVPMALCSEKGQFLKTNKAFRQVFGFTEDQLRSRTFRELTYQEDVDAGLRKFEQLVKGEISFFSQEKRYLTADGQIVWGHVTVSATRESQGQFHHAVAMVEDITERKRAEAQLRQAAKELETRVELRTAELTDANEQLRDEVSERKRAEIALRESEARIRALLDAIPDLMLRIRRDGSLVDHHAKDETIAMSIEQMARKSIDQVFPQHVAQSISQCIEQTLQGKHLEVFEFDLPAEVEQKTAQTYEARFVVSGRDEVLAIIRNITERRRAEEQARVHQTQLAHVARLNSMGEMATDLAHELNQPLAAIMNYAESYLREMKASQQVPDHWLDGASQVIAQAERAGEIIKRIRSFVERREPHGDPIEVNRTIEDAVELTAPEARLNRVDVHLTLKQNLPCVLGDAIQIEQVVLNLVRNAIDAMVEQGSKIRQIDIQTSLDDERQVVVKVTDTGPGLVKPSIDNVFEPFYTTKADGLGMGLTISRSIVEAHGGKLSASKNPHQDGACFSFTLPVHSGGLRIPNDKGTNRVRGG